jgi:hypothetical protein
MYVGRNAPSERPRLSIKELPLIEMRNRSAGIPAGYPTASSPRIAGHAKHPPDSRRAAVLPLQHAELGRYLAQGSASSLAEERLEWGIPHSVAGHPERSGY